MATRRTGEGNSDENGHGTHVAGTCAGKTHGVAKRATIFGIKVFDATGMGSSVRVLQALQKVTELAKGEPSVVNMSMGGPRSGPNDSIMARAIQQLVSKGIAVVVAAGNESQDACNVAPGTSILSGYTQIL
jgi:subtilisin family serine protease